MSPFLALGNAIFFDSTLLISTLKNPAFKIASFVSGNNLISAFETASRHACPCPCIPPPFTYTFKSTLHALPVMAMGEIKRNRHVSSLKYSLTLRRLMLTLPVPGYWITASAEDRFRWAEAKELILPCRF